MEEVVSGALVTKTGSFTLVLLRAGKALGTAAECSRSYAVGDSPSPAGVYRAAATEDALVQTPVRERKRRAR